MIFEMDERGSQRKLKTTLPIIVDLQYVQRAMATSLRCVLQVMWGLICGKVHV